MNADHSSQIRILLPNIEFRNSTSDRYGCCLIIANYAGQLADLKFADLIHNSEPRCTGLDYLINY
ncbi:transcriptional regulator, putative [Trichinella spiralis]|uniref:transcriptional regulator, putative n=1 Tax=Trichinella spiralis TaxID=6334 RepID=UPI0001EFB22F|nr:transcriptional regulator, putative [Trichinella spiralis]